MQHALLTTPAAARNPGERPSRAQIEPAALALLSRHSAGLLACARRWSATPEDAEDAYQRGVEILLTKAPTTHEDELLPWLKTVVKHEAYAVGKSNGRAQPCEGVGESEPDTIAWTDERAERYEQLRVGAEAMANLKPQEIRCLLLRAEGLSYKEICTATAFSYTKVNRCITEGRRAFLSRVASIESGAECERLAPLISRVADGEASGAEMRAARPHLKSCLACKATLREYRAAPARLAGLVPPVVALAGSGGGLGGFLARALQGLHERFGGLAEMAGAQKAAAIAASAAVLAGGGAAGVQAIHHDAPRVAPAAFEPTADGPVAAPARPDSTTSPIAYTAPAQPPAEPASGAAPATGAASPGGEFDPGTAKTTRPQRPAPASAPRGPAEFGP